MATAILLLSSFTCVAVAQLSFFPNNTLIVAGNISTACTTAMNATIDCDPYIMALATLDDYTSVNNDTIQQSVCATKCGAALSKYHKSVASSCAQDPLPWDGTPATYIGDFAWAYYNGSCLKDTATGQWCKGTWQIGKDFGTPCSWRKASPWSNRDS